MSHMMNPTFNTSPPVINENTLKYYRKYVNEDKQCFESYNSVSISNLLMPMSGMFGDEPKELAIKLMKKFIIWYRGMKQDNYFPKYGCQQMYPLSALEGTITIAETYTAIEPKKKMELFNNLIIESQKNVQKVSLNEYIKQEKKLQGDKMINLCAVAGGAVLGWLASHIFKAARN